MLTSKVNTLIPYRTLTIFSLGIIAAALYFGQYVGRLEPLAPNLSAVTDRLAQQVAVKMPGEAVPAPLLVLPLQGDYTRTLRDQLHAAIHGHGRYPVLNLGYPGNALKQIGIDTPMVDNSEDAAKIGRLLGADRILFGRVEHINTDAQGRFLAAFTVKLADRDGHMLWAERFSSDEGMAPHEPPTYIAAIGWLCLTILLPFLLWPLTRQAIRQDSNLSSAILLLTLSAASTAIAMLLMTQVYGWRLQDILYTWIPVATLVSIWVVHWVCGFVLRLQS